MSKNWLISILFLFSSFSAFANDANLEELHSTQFEHETRTIPSEDQLIEEIKTYNKIIEKFSNFTDKAELYRNSQDYAEIAAGVSALLSIAYPLCLILGNTATKISIFGFTLGASITGAVFYFADRDTKTIDRNDYFIEVTDFFNETQLNAIRNYINDLAVLNQLNQYVEEIILLEKLKKEVQNSIDYKLANDEDYKLNLQANSSIDQMKNLFSQNKRNYNFAKAILIKTTFSKNITNKQLELYKNVH